MTENCRVKTARSLAGTLPLNLGRATSLPFSLTEETRICWRRRTAITASFVSADCSPETALPSRFFPFQTKAGIRILLSATR